MTAGFVEFNHFAVRIITEVTSKKDLKAFVRFPLDLYKDCPQYVPALDSDQYKSLTKVSTLSYCQRKMWLVRDDGKVVGRICGMINPRYNEIYNTKRARFGWFDCINDLEVARLLIETAEKWAKEQGMEEIHGPLYYNTLGKQGMLVEGFENIPPFNCLYNFAYYNDLVTALGFEKECDWIQYKVRADQPVPEKVVSIAARLKERYKLREGDLETLRHDKALVRQFFHMYSDSFATSVYNFIPFTDEEIEEEAESVMGMLDPRLCCFLVDEDDEIAAFGIGFPSISKGLQKAKGRLFPFGWYHLLKSMKDVRLADLMINGAAPKWQKTGISSVYHCMMSTKYTEAGVKWCITNPQIESNTAVNVWDRYSDKELFMRRRCYIKKINA